jgi:hypothetical protein
MDILHESLWQASLDQLKAEREQSRRNGKLSEMIRAIEDAAKVQSPMRVSVRQA